MLQHFKAQEESYREMENLAESIRNLPSQLDRLKDVPKSRELCGTINEFPGIMKEVVEFIDKWLESWSGACSVMWDGLTTKSLVAARYILVVPHKDEAIELRKKVDGFRERFTVELMVEMRIGQGLVSVTILVNHLIHGTSRRGERREDCTSQCCKYPRWVVCCS